MKGERFVAGQLWIERNRNEGPPVVYTVLRQNSKTVTDQVLLKFVNGSRAPDRRRVTRMATSFDQKPKAPAPDDMAKIRLSFGPEAHDDVQPPIR